MEFTELSMKQFKIMKKRKNNGHIWNDEFMNNDKNNTKTCKQVKVNDYINNEAVHKIDGIEKKVKVTFKNISKHKYNSI